MEEKKNYTDFIINLVIFIIAGVLLVYGLVSCGIRAYKNWTSVKVYNLESFSLSTGGDNVEIDAFDIEQTDHYFMVSFDIKDCPEDFSCLTNATCTMAIDGSTYTDECDLEESDSGYMFVFFNFNSDDIPLEPELLDLDISIQGEEEYDILVTVTDASYSESRRDPEPWEE